METKDLNLENGNDLAAEVVAKESNDEKEMKSVEDFQNFIKENNIKTPGEFKRRFKKVYLHAAKLKIKGFLEYPIYDYLGNFLEYGPERSKSYNTLEQFEKFISQKNIKSPLELFNRFCKMYIKASKLGLLPHLFNNFINDAIVIQEFLDTYKIGNPTEFKIRYYTHYRIVKNLPEIFNNLNYENSLPDYTMYNTLDDINKFILDNNIQCPTELSEKANGLYQRAKKLGFSSKLTYPARKEECYDNYLTIEDFQKYIDDHPEIDSPTKFSKLKPGLYSRAVDMKLAFYLNYSNRQYISKILGFDTIEDYNNFLKDKPEIQTISEFRRDYLSLYRRAQRLGFIESINLYQDSDSKGEALVKEILTEAKINWEDEKTFPWLKYIGYQRLDFWLPDLNIAIEVQGEQHFIPIFEMNQRISFEEQRKMDLNKYNLCKKYNIPILYFANIIKGWRDPNEINNFFAPVKILTKENLLNEIENFANRML